MTTRPTLDEVAIQHGTDKSSRIHHYTRIYERLFEPWRDKPIRLLEIGVSGGGSLQLWQDYFSQGHFAGLDVKECSSRVNERTTIFTGNQSDEVVLRELGESAGPFDIVIDDGSHFWDDQITSFRCLFPFVSPGGYYIVEDVHTSYWSRYKRGDLTTVTYFQGLVDEVNMRGRSGYGEPRNDPEYASLAGAQAPLPASIESLTFYKSLIIAQKRGESPSPAALPQASSGQEPYPKTAIASETTGAAAVQRVGIATRSMNPRLYEASGALLAFDRLKAKDLQVTGRVQFNGTDNFGYFRELLKIDVDWVISLDEDAFVLQPQLLLDLVRYLARNGFAACGMPDGGVVQIRRHNPVACNAFFNVFDLRRVRTVWQDWGCVVSATHRPEYEKFVAPFAGRSLRACDHFERYYGVFFSLLHAGVRI